VKKVWCIFKREMANSERILVEAWSTENSAINRMYSEYMMKPRSCFYHVDEVLVNTASRKLRKVAEQTTNTARQAPGAKPPSDPNAAKTRGTSALLNR
jgi:hypothetical protein